MAKILGTTEGFVPQAFESGKPAPRPLAVGEAKCKICGGLIRAQKIGRRIEVPRLLNGECEYCDKIFGAENPLFGWQPGVTNMTPRHAAERIARIASAQWCVVLRRGQYGAPDGRTVEVEPGDIIKVARAGLTAGASEDVCWERSKQAFSIDVNIAGIVLTQWPHEVAEISFVTVMELKRAGEIEECYVSAGDEAGHFRPIAELRESIYAAYGSLVNS